MQLEHEAGMHVVQFPTDHILEFATQSEARDFVAFVRQAGGGKGQEARGSVAWGSTDGIAGAAQQRVRERLFDEILPSFGAMETGGSTGEASTLGMPLLASVFDDATVSALVPEQIPRDAANASLQCGIGSLRLMLVPEVAMHSLAFVERARLAWVISSFLFPRVKESLEATNLGGDENKELSNRDRGAERNPMNRRNSSRSHSSSSTTDAERADDDDYNEEEEKKDDPATDDSGDEIRPWRDGSERGGVRALQLRIRPSVNVRLERLTLVVTEYRGSKESENRDEDGKLAMQHAWDIAESDQDAGVDVPTSQLRLGPGLSAIQVDLVGFLLRTAGAKRNATDLMQSPALVDAMGAIIDEKPPEDCLQAAVLEPQIGLDMLLEQC